MKYKGFEIIGLTQYHVWKDGFHLFSGSRDNCKGFINNQEIKEIKNQVSKK